MAADLRLATRHTIVASAETMRCFHQVFMSTRASMDAEMSVSPRECSEPDDDVLYFGCMGALANSSLINHRFNFRYDHVYYRRRTPPNGVRRSHEKDCQCRVHLRRVFGFCSGFFHPIFFRPWGLGVCLAERSGAEREMLNRHPYTHAGLHATP